MKPDSGEKPNLNPAAIPIAQAARVLTRASGERVTEEMIQADIAAGAPTNRDGTIHLVRYAAWLLKEMTRE